MVLAYLHSAIGALYGVVYSLWTMANIPHDRASTDHTMPSMTGGVAILRFLLTKKSCILTPLSLSNHRSMGGLPLVSLGSC